MIRELRSDTSTWPNLATQQVHIWSHLGREFRAHKVAANRYLAGAGIAWTESTTRAFVEQAMIEPPPDVAPGEVDYRWLAVIWNRSAGLSNELHTLGRA